MLEEWRPAVGFAGYEVSDLGRVRSLPRFVPHRLSGQAFRQGRVLVSLGGWGRDNLRWRYTRLSVDGVKHQVQIVDLMREAFPEMETAPKRRPRPARPSKV